MAKNEENFIKLLDECDPESDTTLKANEVYLFRYGVQRNVFLLLDLSYRGEFKNMRNSLHT